MKNKKICGVATNDAEYVTSVYEKGQKRKLTWRCPFYNVWFNMINRVYGKYKSVQHSFYEDSVVCDEWLTFSNFKAWMEKQDWKGKQLDKDILVVGNKHYSPETCVFVTGEANGLVKDFKTNNTSGITNVRLMNGKYYSQIRINNRLVSKSFNDKEEAVKFWIDEKIKTTLQLKDNERVKQKIIERYEYLKLKLTSFDN